MQVGFDLPAGTSLSQASYKHPLPSPAALKLWRSQNLGSSPSRIVKPAPKAIPPNLQPWFEARRRFNLSHATVQMARELGLNPKKFGGLADTKASPWKAPLAEFIARCYYKAHKRHSPEVIRSLEQVIKDTEDKKARRHERKAQRAEHVSSVALEQSPQANAANEA